MAAYRFTNDTSVWRKELSSFCRMASWSILSKNISQIITYTTLYYVAEIYTKNQWYTAWKDSLFLHHSYKPSTDICWNRFIWVQSNPCFTVFYTERTRVKRRKYIKLSLGADVLKQIICVVKIRRAPIRHDTIDFHSLITKISAILPLSVVTADKGYDSEDNHVLIREQLHAYSVIPVRYENVPIWKTHGRYRKQMKYGYSKLLYNQRNKDETIISVIKRLFGEYITSKSVKTQNRELCFRCIAYNMHRLTNLIVVLMVST